ncbi:YwqG family protein [Plantactinospora veratri]
MSHSTIASPIDMREVFPQVVPFARRAIRLHPRKGSPGVEQSSVGGPLLWPADEPWPGCGGVHPEDHLDAGPDDPAQGPLVPVLQLFAADVPDLPFPAGTDMLQVLWCPFDHEPWCSPRPELRWRRRADVGARRETMPAPHEDADPATIPDPCTVDPERVVEYPSHDLPREVWRQIDGTVRRVAEETGWQYEYDLSEASGIKVGGYPGWTQSPDWPVCGCGTGMVHLLTVASWEFSRGDEKRWIPVEDRPAMAGWSFDGDDDHPWRGCRTRPGSCSATPAASISSSARPARSARSTTGSTAPDRTPSGRDSARCGPHRERPY